MSNKLQTQIEKIFQKYKVPGLSIATIKGQPCHCQATLQWGNHRKGGSAVEAATRFQMASLSKTVATAFAIELFASLGISMEESVNDLLKKYGSQYLLKAAPGSNPAWADSVKINQLMNHTALGMHYVAGHPLGNCPSSLALLEGAAGSAAILVAKEPGKIFSYSGGGFILLQYILELITQENTESMMRSFLDGVGLKNFHFEPQRDGIYAWGYRDNGDAIENGRLTFPALAAGGEGSPETFAQFLCHLVNAYHNVSGSGALSHNTAVQMLYPGRDRGSLAFMGAYMGLGVFIAEAGDNRIALHQAANDGFRGLYAICFEGVNCGDGFVITSNSDHQAMLLNCEVARFLLQDWQGITLGDMNLHLDGDKQEEIVNLGIKAALTDFFEPRLPERPKSKGPKSDLSRFNKVMGAKILYCSGQQFARAENLFSPYDPVFDPLEFGVSGKIMDSWESQRHNTETEEFVIFELSHPVSCDLVQISTKFHDGNHCEAASLDAWDYDQNIWISLLSTHKLFGHSEHWFKLVPTAQKSWSRFKLSGYPDGGISRIGLYRKQELASEMLQVSNWGSDYPLVTRYQEPIPKAPAKHIKVLTIDEEQILKFWQQHHETINVASALSGAKISACSDQHYGPAHHILSPESPQGMFDGLETKRSRGEHHEFVTVLLNRPCDIVELEFDFSYFIFNNPLYLDVCGEVAGEWQTLVPQTNVKAWRGNLLRLPCKVYGVKLLRIKLYPDGGLNRFRAYGQASVG